MRIKHALQRALKQTLAVKACVTGTLIFLKSRLQEEMEGEEKQAVSSGWANGDTAYALYTYLHELAHLQ
ncbi:hypothetical protein KDAU_63550 [Dictyobacter aurantiacus]|uniref:Uncharacterized protein n=1 Tax=Dictyobacter aurantiacus TaxID=1936993 RepID=A0A401ZQJ5_9CHLR|nr:hypothetical protein KDAU_63550 [Dictyobacter aurantiacus]